MSWAAHSTELVWAASLAAIPVAIIASVCSRWKWVRPATRHALWFAVLATLLSPAIIGLWRPAWFRSERVLAAADTAVDTVIRSAKTAKSAYAALAPLDRAPTSTLLDQPDVDSPPVLSNSTPEPALNNAVNKFNARPRRTDLQPPRSDYAPTLAALPTTTPVATSAPTTRAAPAPRRNQAFVGPMPFTQSMLSDAELATIPPPPAPWVVKPAFAPPRVSAFDQFRDWLGHLLAVRDAVAAVPAIPPTIWIGGAGVVASLWLVRFVRVKRMLRNAEPAPEPMVALVRRLAGVAGVKRIPETLIVDDRISPMIWCGLKPRLVIPRALWGELDARCQCAVIVHELSHLRRRDHRLCILESLIGLVYWWHPVAWWARRRLRDEAEACCDAWVTTLLPGGRRAYAEALVATKSFLCTPGLSGAPGLGVVSGRTRQLARRLTMVMTQRVAPRASLLGLAFALAIGAAGMFVMPGLACPPEDDKPSAQAKVVAKTQAASKKDQEAKAKAKVKAKTKNEKHASGQAFLGEAPALEAMRRGQPGQPALDGQMNTLKDMEKSLQQMEDRLKEMQRRLESMQNRPGSPRSQGGTDSPAAPRAVVAGGQGLRGLTMNTTPMVVAPRAATVVEVGPNDGPTTGREYKLPKGKLDALVSLMARDDVPIFISSDGDSITVNATPQQHRIFQAFVAMIHPEGHSNAGNLHLERSLYEHALAEHARAGQHSTAHRDAIRAQAEQLRSTARTLAAQKANSVRQSEQVKREIERARKNAEKARDKARKSGDDVEAEKAEEAIECEIEALECQLESIDGVCEGFDCQIESIEEAIESLTQALENADEVSAATPPTPAMAPAPPSAPAPTAISIPAVAPVPTTTPAPPAPPSTPAPGAAPTPAAAPLTTAGTTPVPAAPPAAR
jgi:beta-lactamase regulating signal transducer with metallopeptidase domain